MKKILIALAITGISLSGAQAQTTRINACGVKKDQVCRVSADKKSASCYKTKYASNFAVCKSDHGYFICCETPNSTNSTFSRMPLATERRSYQNTYAENTNNKPAVDMSVPQSQSYSYVMNSTNSYEGYYGKRNYIKVCNTSDNVAEQNAAPYKGCPSAASEGPEVNNYRNINVANPMPMPPSYGRAHE